MKTANGRQWDRFANTCILVLIYFVVAAASFNGFYDKWSLRDGKVVPLVSIESMLDGSAARPFVYRQLLPMIANAVDAVLPQRISDRIVASAILPDGTLYTKIRSRVAADPRYLIRYHLVYYMSFLFLFFSMFFMRRICLAAGADLLSATLAPTIFVLFLPFMLTVGGYFYDLSELFFLMSAIALAMTRKYRTLLAVSAIAALNKESFVLFVPALCPLLRMHLPVRKVAVLTTALMAIAGAVLLGMHWRYRANPGSAAEFHLLWNLFFYANPKNFFAHEGNYGLITWKGYNLIFLGLIVLLVTRGWRELSVRIRQHILVAAAVNLPLFLLLCAPGELRDLSMLYGGLLLLTAQLISGWIAEVFSLPDSRGEAGYRGEAAQRIETAV